MIFHDSKTEIRFGTGDISCQGAITPEEKLGHVFFRENGLLGPIEMYDVGTEVDLNDFPIVMTFSNIKSIDTIINLLIKLKDDMLREGIE